MSSKSKKGPRKKDPVIIDVAVTKPTYPKKAKASPSKTTKPAELEDQVPSGGAELEDQVPSGGAELEDQVPSGGAEPANQVPSGGADYHTRKEAFRLELAVLLEKYGFVREAARHRNPKK